MAPTFRDGDVVLADRAAYAEQRPEPGEVVLARHPFVAGAMIVKRVARVTDDGGYFLVGDNRALLESTDSRSFGPLRRDRILGRIVGPA